MINNVVLEGRLTKEPELRKTGSGTSVVQFTLAVERSFKNKNGDRDADFINCIAWRKAAEFVNGYFHKGQGLSLTGELQTRSYDDKSGNRVFVTEVVASSINFPIQNKEQNNAGGATNNTSQSSNTQAQAQSFDAPFANSGSVDINDNDLPF